MVRLDARLLKSLEGRSFRLGTSSFSFVRSDNHLPAARQGGEGYAIPVQVGVQAYILKIYHLLTTERWRRILFLTALALRDAASVFAAAPARAVRGELPIGDDTVAVTGYLAPLVVGQTLEALLQEGWDPPPPARLRLAAQLACAVALLEQVGLAHADLSSGNLMVEDPHGNPRLRLIDFDGFAHAGVPVVPTATQRGGRGFGSDGYRHAAYAAMDEATVVRCDRLALAALMFELVTLTGNDLNALGRGTLLDQDQLDRRQLALPDPLCARWPAGWRLLARAAAAETPEAAPSPAQWLDALASRATMAAAPPAARMPTVLAGPPVPVRILRPDGQDLRVNLTRSENNFGSVDPRLGWLSYVRRGARLVLRGQPPSPAELCRHGQPAQQVAWLDVEAQPGDVLRHGGFDLTIG